MRTLILSLFAATTACLVMAKEPLPLPDSHQAGNQHYSYPYRTVEPPTQTPAPKGYEPFHMEHYGRHGSRYLCVTPEYSDAPTILGKAHSHGKLTPLGEKIYNYVADVELRSRGRLGDLTDMGALEHQAIGRRMAQNFPTIFAPGTHVDAKSSIVIRCIISMLNELKEIQAVEPGLIITSDASEAEMYYMVPGWSPKADQLKQHTNSTLRPAFSQSLKDSGDFARRLFNDQQYVADSVDTALLSHRLFCVLEGAQNHLGEPWYVDEVFSRDEILNHWRRTNAMWHVEAGLHDMTAGLSPYQRATTLRNFIASADTAMVSRNISANLRFGHDGIVYPLAMLMELNGLWQKIDTFEELDGRQHDYLTIPMACNIQLVFYRPTTGAPTPDNVLVKVLLNETEVTMPVETAEVGFPYYPWPAVRQFYLDKLANAPEGSVL